MVVGVDDVAVGSVDPGGPAVAPAPIFSRWLKAHERLLASRRAQGAANDKLGWIGFKYSQLSKPVADIRLSATHRPPEELLWTRAPCWWRSGGRRMAPVAIARHPAFH